MISQNQLTAREILIQNFFQMCNYHKIKMKLLKGFMLITALLLFNIMLPYKVNAQDSLIPQSVDVTVEGREMFRVCAACHTIGGGKLIGPDLKGVNERHDEEWLIKFIQNSQEVIASGDETAVKLFEEYNKVTMPPNNLSDDQRSVGHLHSVACLRDR